LTWYSPPSVSQAFTGLTPRGLWHRFDEITRIGRPSGGEQQVSAYIQAWARQEGHLYRRDDVGNSYVSVRASAGREREAPLILQAHLDMVCEGVDQAAAERAARGQIDLVRTGDWVKARGTTLGADNGVGVATMLSLAEASGVAHGPLELLFTVEEETTFRGANGVNPGFLSGRTLLNLDSEDDGMFCIGSAGGCDIRIKWDGPTEAVPRDWVAVDVVAHGLLGGHSGIDIDKSRVNAIVDLAKLIAHAGEGGNFRLAMMNGGSKSNVIPRESRARLWVPPTEVARVSQRLREEAGRLSPAVGGVNGAVPDTPPDCLSVDIQSIAGDDGDHDAVAFTAQGGMALASLLTALPCGVIARSQDLPGLVETSSNIAILRTTSSQVEVVISLRSSNDRSLSELRARIQSLVQRCGHAEMSIHDEYPSWPVVRRSRLLDLANTVFLRLFSREPAVTALHAGLECGAIGRRVPRMDMLSLGPQILGAHTPEERVSISSVQRFWKLLVQLVNELSIPQRKRAEAYEWGTFRFVEPGKGRR
jgi:dipeptidase D